METKKKNKNPYFSKLWIFLKWKLKKKILTFRNFGFFEMETKKINSDFLKPWILNGILQCYLVVHAKLCLIELTKPIQQTRVYFLFQQWR